MTDLHINGFLAFAGMTEFIGMSWFDWIPAFAGMTGRLRRNDLPDDSIFHHILYARPQGILIHPDLSTVLSSCK